ncbi:MAG TPA: serine hydrolase [Candidatus Paceibacterota bacterium]|nr:serine hydrolase [Candidatus Paceibacterota bacterium]HMP19115.1 serine hydrolase [Candidatus Paceibacterota bacterium]HMP85119.1 serine hydrolase [Candidatus Paceibacterota bacterium]
MKIRFYIFILLIMWGIAGTLTYYVDDLSFFKKQNVESEEFYGGLEIIKVSGEYSKIDQKLDFPKLTSDVYVVADLETGEVIESKNADEIYAIASLTKMMTAIVSVDTIDQYSPVNITKQAVDTYGQQGNLRVGEILSANELLYPLLLESSNDASEALAIFAGRNNFLKNMNNKAISLGMSKTNFDDASGLSALNLSTANDLLNLTMYINKNYPELWNITKKKDYRLGRRIWRNNSRFINDKNYIGGKNGYTEAAKLTIISLFDLPLSEVENRKIAIIILQSSKIEKDVRDTLFYLLRNVEHKRI